MLSITENELLACILQKSYYQTEGVDYDVCEAFIEHLKRFLRVRGCYTTLVVRYPFNPWNATDFETFKCFMKKFYLKSLEKSAIYVEHIRYVLPEIDNIIETF